MSAPAKLIEVGEARFWRATLGMAIGSFLVFTNLYVIHPLLPLIATEFSLSPVQANAGLTATTLMLGISLLFYGPLSDAVGRRALMLLSMGGAVLITFAVGFAPDFSSLVYLRALQGLFLGGIPAIAIAYMGDEFSPQALITAVGIYIGGNTIGGISGRLLGGFLGEYFGWHGAFIALGFLSVLCFTLLFYLLPPSKHFVPRRLHASALLGGLFAHLRNRFLLPAFLVGGFSFFVFINQYSYLTFVLEAPPFSLSPRWLGLLFLTYLAGTFSAAMSGRIARFMPQPLIMLAGTLLFALGSLITLVENLALIILGLSINSFGFFLAHSAASSWVNRQASVAKASASSLYLVFYYLGASAGGYYLNPFWQASAWQGVVLGSMLILLLVMFACLYLWRKERSLSS